MRVKWYLLLLILVCTGWAQQLFNPAAVDRRRNGSLFILDLDTKDYDKVLVFEDTFPQLSFKTSFNLPYGFQRLGMVSLKLGGEEYVFVSEVFAGRGFIQQYAVPSGHPVKRWNVGPPCARLGIDESNLRLYAVSPSSNEIFQLDLNTGKVNTIAEIHLAGSLGPIAVDAANKKLFVADSREGDLYEVSLLLPVRFHKIADRLGQPTALALDENNQALYIYDGDHMRIWVKEGSNRPIIFSKRQPQFRAPSGMTLGNNGTLWLLDRNARAIFRLLPGESVAKLWPPT